jgi:GMP synthase-like glutamine amidotransferase
MKKILFLQNGTMEYSVSRVDLRFEEAGFEVDYCWAYNNIFPKNLDGYAGAFISGSPHGAYEDIPWIQQEHQIIEALAKREVPMLGVCFGTQILASALCGQDQVFRRETCEVDYKDLEVHHPEQHDPLLVSIGNKVRMFIWHNDEVRHDHPDMQILASSDLCPNQIWRYRDLPMWGIQGHPELTREQATLVFQENRDRLSKDGADVDQLISSADEAIEAKQLLSNFFHLCLQ